MQYLKERVQYFKKVMPGVVKFVCSVLINITHFLVTVGNSCVIIFIF